MKHISRIAALILAVLVLCTGCGSSVSPEKYSTTAAATYGDQTAIMPATDSTMLPLSGLRLFAESATTSTLRTPPMAEQR